ncbi:MAG: hypothetical protein K0R65_1157 [Crocinitomicaceae bacterium]|jgi:uncharacterized protein (DUF58 family)|nr:hypothetical protein [Crocinitomicaceae bacterium]
MKLFQSLHITRFFFILLAAVVILFVAAAAWDWLFYIALVAAACFCGFFILDVILTFSIRKPVEVSRHMARILNLGDENTVDLTIENTTNQPINLLFYEGFPVEMQMRNAERHFFLLPGEKKHFSYVFRPKTRGDFRFGNVEIFISSLLFLCKRKMIFELEQTVQVYPSILQMKQYELKVFHQQTRAQGIKKIRRIGHNNEFEQIKNYVQGDDVRTVNWKATSKKSELMVNQYQEERSQSVYSVIDKSRNMQMEFEGMTMLDYAINSTLVFSNIAIKKGDRAGLITFSDKIGTQLQAERNAGQLRRILNLLYNQKTHFREASYELLYESIHQTVKTRSLLMLYTNFESEFAMRRALPTLRRLNQKHVLVLVFFQNNEMEELAYQRIDNVENIYQSAVAEKLINLKVSIARELKQHGIQTLLTRPEDLNVSTINKYLELKAKGVI